MKEAAGEANMTVITIVLIAIVLAVGTIIVRSMMSNTNDNSACSACGGVWQNSRCYRPSNCNASGICEGGTINYDACKK